MGKCKLGQRGAAQANFLLDAQLGSICSGTRLKLGHCKQIA
jgi:hypothetical protein